MGILDIIKRLSPPTRPDFIAPITPPTKEIYTKVGDVPFVYHRKGIVNGWRRLHYYKPDKGLLWMPEKPPQADEIESYMSLVRPSWLLIVLYRLDDETWLCHPFNRGDAQQKGWAFGPVPVYLVTDTIEPFDTIYAKGSVSNLIYWRREGELHTKQHLVANLDSPKDIFEGTDGDFATCYRIIRERMLEAKKKEAEAARQRQIQTVEGRIRYNLAFLGANLVSWKESGNDIVITWQDKGITYNSRINTSMGVTAAGICLAGGDRAFNVAALVDVMREARQRNRPGAGGITNGEYETEYDNEDD